MKTKEILFVLLSIVVLFSASISLGEESWVLPEAVGNSSDRVYGLTETNNGGFVVAYSDGDRLVLAKYVRNGSTFQLSGDEQVITNDGSYTDLNVGGMVMTVESGQEYFYVYGMAPEGVQSWKGFLFKYNSQLEEEWRKKFDHYLAIFSVAVVKQSGLDDSLFMVGENQDVSSLRTIYSKVDFDGNELFFRDPGSEGYANFEHTCGAVSQIDDRMVVRGYSGTETPVMFYVNLSDGSFSGLTQVSSSGLERLENIFSDGEHIGYLMSYGDKLYVVDTNFQNLQSYQFGEEVVLCGSDGKNFIIRVKETDGGFTYCMVRVLDNDIEVIDYFDFMSDVQGTLIKGSDDDYFGAGSIGTGIKMYYHKPDIDMPTADAGVDQDVEAGDIVYLDGTNSNGGTYSLDSYSWEIVEGEITAIFSQSQTATPTFIAKAGQTVVVELTVTDIYGYTDTDTVTITTPAVNNVPTARAGNDVIVDEGEFVTLDGENSFDIDGDELTYSWMQISGREVLLSGADTAVATFVAPGVGPEGESLVFELSVNDGELTAVDTVVVNVTFDNQVPTVNAGGDQVVDEGSSVEMIATGSDPDGQGVSYDWIQTDGPEVILSGFDTSVVTFTAPLIVVDEVTLSFEVSVSDGTLTATDEVIVVVENLLESNPEPDPDPEPEEIVQDSVDGVKIISEGAERLELQIEDISGSNDYQISELYKINAWVAEGDTIFVDVHLREAAQSDQVWIKLNHEGEWINFTDLGRAFFNEDRTVVTLELTDGGLGDADGEANGFIQDPGGLGIEPKADPVDPDPVVSEDGGGGGGGGCFIDTSSISFKGNWSTVLSILTLALFLMFIYRKRSEV